MAGRPRSDLVTAIHARFLPGEKLAPPADLSEEQLAEWDRYLLTMPSGFLSHEHASLLRELCRHTVFARQLGDKIQAGLLEMMALPLTSKGWVAFCRLLKAHGEQVDAMIRLSRSLRLTKQSRDDRGRAMVATRRFGTEPPAWEDWANLEPDEDAPAEEPAKSDEPAKQ